MSNSSQFFLKVLSDSTLLSEDKLSQAQQYALEEPDPKRLAETLVRQQWVTDWQARKLLEGKRQFLMGNYKLLDLLGRGGMGAVYRAEHLGLRRQVALKVMSQKYLTNERAVSRFLAEIRMISDLDHPNIVKAFDADFCQNRYFLVMEYIPGRSLEQWLNRKGRFFVGWACQCVREVALGLQHAAEKSLIHRDVKPSNLIVPDTRLANQPIVKLLDFGLAYCLGEMEDLQHTQAGRTVGTVDYMAPEQSVSSRDADARSDIYSLGTVFYHLLTGQLPLEGRNSMERLNKRMTEIPAPPSGFRADLPQAIDQIVAKMIDPKPSRRFHWPSDVADALEPFAEVMPAMPPMGLPPKRIVS